MTRGTRNIFIVLTLVFLVSCTAKVSYRFLDRMVAWSVDDYVSWTDDQQLQFDLLLDQQLRWHQSTQLPRYSDLLQQFKKDLQQPLTPTLLDQRLQALVVFWSDMMAHISPDVADLLARLSDDQVDSLIASLRQKITESEQEYEARSALALAEHRIERVENTAKRFIGRLTPEQDEIVVQWEQSLGPGWREWIKSRKQWASKLEQALQVRHQAGFDDAVTRLYVSRQSYWSEAYRRQSDENMRKGIKLVVALVRSLTDKQRRQLNGEIDYWIETFDELAAETKAPSR